MKKLLGIIGLAIVTIIGGGFTLILLANVIHGALWFPIAIGVFVLGRVILEGRQNGRDEV